MPTKDCRFCEPREDQVVISNDLCYGTWDGHPVNEGHMLLIPYRHVPDYFQADAEEKFGPFGAGSLRSLPKSFSRQCVFRPTA